MAAADFSRGKMDIESQKRTWQGFLAASQWGGLIIVLAVAYMVFTLAIGINWFVALILCAGTGIVGGLLMGMGGAWMATVIGLAGLAIFIQILISVSRALVSG